MRTLKITLKLIFKQVINDLVSKNGLLVLLSHVSHTHGSPRHFPLYPTLVREICEDKPKIRLIFFVPYAKTYAK